MTGHSKAIRNALAIGIFLAIGVGISDGSDHSGQHPLDKVYFRGLGCEWFPQAREDLQSWLRMLKERGFNMIQATMINDPLTTRKFIEACHNASVTVFAYSGFPRAGKWVSMSSEEWGQRMAQLRELVDTGFDGVIYDFATWEEHPKSDFPDSEADYWDPIIGEFNRRTAAHWTREALAKDMARDEGPFGQPGGVTQQYNRFRCEYHAEKAKEIADLASSYAASQGRRFWVSFYLPDTEQLGTSYQLLDEALPLLAPMIYGPIEVRNADRMVTDINYHVPPRPRHSKAIVCVEAGFPDTGGDVPLPLVMRAVWSTMLSHADGYCLWHAAFACEEDELAIANLNKISEWIFEPLMRGQLPEARQGFARLADLVDAASELGTPDQLLRADELCMALGTAAEKLDQPAYPAELENTTLETLYASAQLLWEFQQAQLIAATQQFELPPWSFAWRPSTGSLHVSGEDMHLWQDNKAGNIDGLRIRGLGKNVAAGSRGDWGFCRQRGSLDEWGYRCRNRLVERGPHRVVVDTELHYPRGLVTVRRTIFEKGKSLIRVVFEICNRSGEPQQVSPRLWNCLNLGPGQRTRLFTRGAKRAAAVQKDDFFAIIVAPTQPTDYTAAWREDSDQFDMQGKWTLTPGERQLLEFAFAIGRGGTEALRVILTQAGLRP